MPPQRLARWLLLGGVAACIPAAVAIGVFASGVAEANAINQAPLCATPTQDAASICLSVFNGTILERKAHGILAIEVRGQSYDVDYDCLTSPNGSCSKVSLDAGAEVSTGWRKGMLVTLGPAEARPNIATGNDPLEHLAVQSFLFGAVIAAVSLLLGGVLLRQAPMTDHELVAMALKRWPQPPRLVDRATIRRVAWGYDAWPMFVLWSFLYMVPLGFIVGLGGQAVVYLGPLYLIATGVVSIGLGMAGAPAYLAGIVQRSVNRAVVVTKVESGLGKSGKDTMVWYELSDGKRASKLLDPPWNGLVHEADRLDALVDPKTGRVERLLATPPAQA